MRLVIFFVMALVLSPVYAGPVVTYDFASEEQEALFNKLSNELRCLVCQNQAISDSNADLAKDLRDEIYGMLQQGKSEEEIVEFMVVRYGDFVLYRPPIKPMTWLLWFAPVIIFAFGLVYVVRFLKSQAADGQPASLSEEEIERIKNLHTEQDNK